MNGERLSKAEKAEAEVAKLLRRKRDSINDDQLLRCVTVVVKFHGHRLRQLTFTAESSMELEPGT